MKKLEEFMEKRWRQVFFFLLLIIFFNTCGGPNRTLSKKIEVLSAEIDSLKQTSVSKKDLRIEGLKTEKRMIQSTDRKILDVNRQSEIDREIDQLSK
jgi:hypothetical protein